MSLKKNTVFFALICCFIACTEKKTDPDNIYQYRSYISSTTAGIVSKESTIEVYFARSMRDGIELQELPTDILQIQPKIKGVLTAQNENSIQFKPNENLKPNTEYSVKVKLDALFDNVSEEKKTYTFQFKTIKPSYKVSVNNLQSYSKDWQFLEGSIEASDVIALTDAKKMINAIGKEDDISIVWNESYKKSKGFDFKIDSIRRIDKDQEIRILWKGSPIDSEIQGEQLIKIPGKDNFEVTKVEIVNDDSQYIAVNFSDPIKKDQNLIDSIDRIR